MPLSSVRLSWDAVEDAVEYLIRYKKSSDTDWTTPSSGNPTTNTYYDGIPAEDNTSYDYNIITRCADQKAKCLLFTVNSSVAPVVTQEFSPMASPYNLIYNPVNNLIYVTDYDASGASLYYFDPKTATSVNDFVPVSGSEGLRFAYMAYDEDNNCIYTHGPTSDGLFKLDCSTNTLSSSYVLGYDTGGNFGTGQIIIIAGKVFAYALNAGGFYIYDIANDSADASSPFVPNNPSGYQDIYLIPVDNDLWVLEAGSMTAYARAIVYNASDLSTITNTITDLSTVDLDNGRYTLSNPFYDEQYHKIWFGVPGNNKIGSIDVQTKTVSDSLDIPSEGYTYAITNPVYYEKNNKLYFAGRLTNALNNPGVSRLYLLAPDRSTASIVNTSEANISFTLVYASSTDKTYAVSPGVFNYNTPNTGYDTDGKVQVFT